MQKQLSRAVHCWDSARREAQRRISSTPDDDEESHDDDDDDGEYQWWFFHKKMENLGSLQQPMWKSIGDENKERVIGDSSCAEKNHYDAADDNDHDDDDSDDD